MTEEFDWANLIKRADLSHGPIGVLARSCVPRLDADGALELVCAPSAASLVVPPVSDELCRRVSKALGGTTVTMRATGIGLSFSAALTGIKLGRKFARQGWNGKGLWLEIQRPDAHSKMTLPYIFMSYPDDAQNTPGARVPWLASQTDLLAEDWAEVI